MRMAGKEKIPFAIQRYLGETERLYGVLDTQLSDRDYVVGPGRGRFSIADIAMLGWVNVSPATTINLETQFPHILAWLRRCNERPAVQRGFAVPKEPFVSALKEPDEEAKQRFAESKKVADEAKEKYGYKYTSP